jgi:hypothetical protein
MLSGSPAPMADFDPYAGPPRKNLADSAYLPSVNSGLCRQVPKETIFAKAEPMAAE